MQLTVKQAQIFDYLKERIASGESPTVREIGSQFGIRSPNGVFGHLAALERKGFISREPHERRSIRVIDRTGRADEQ